MKVIDKLVMEWAYRCKKGYPDMNNPDDLRIFEQIFKIPLTTVLGESTDIESAKKGFEYLSTEAQKVALEVANALKIPKEFIKAETRTKVVYLLDMTRPDFFTAVEPLGFKQVSRNTATRDGISIIHKPLSAQIGGGHGKLNEKTFQGILQRILEEISAPATIQFTDGKNSYVVKNVDGVEDTSGKGHSEYSKSDADLYNKGNAILGVSIKMRVGGRWESSKKRFGELYKAFLEKANSNPSKIPNLTLTQRTDSGKKVEYYMQDLNGRNWGKVVVENTPKDLDYETIFGTETKYPTIVVQENFTQDNFSVAGNTVTIKVDKLYTNLSQIEADNKLPVLVFSHHAGVPNGIELRAFPKSALPKREGRSNTLYLNYEDILK